MHQGLKFQNGLAIGGKGGGKNRRKVQRSQNGNPPYKKPKFGKRKKANSEMAGGVGKKGVFKRIQALQGGIAQQEAKESLLL